MDQTLYPVNISPDFLIYAERHTLFELFQKCISTLLVDRPTDPITYLIDYLKKDVDVPKIIILGPPASGRHTIGKLLQKKLNAVLIECEELLRNVPNNLKDKLPEKPDIHTVSPSVWAHLLDERLKDIDCVRRGWILVDFPINRKQALSLQGHGISPRHVGKSEDYYGLEEATDFKLPIKQFVCLEAPDNVLIERAAGKRIDPQTKEIYHITWHVPSSREIQERLVHKEENSEKMMHSRLKEYRRNVDGLKDCYKAVLRVINADQPLNDIFTQVHSYATKKERSVALHTPRIVILGPTGSGRKTVAAQVARKYDIPIISIPTLLKQQVVSKTPLGASVKPYLDRQTLVPDSLLMQTIRDRLNQKDCLAKGWVMIGYPRTREQAESLARAPLTTPTRVFFLNIPLDVALERLTQRSLDPITGNRFHTHDHPVPTLDIKQRVTQHPTDDEETVQKRYQTYSVYSDELHEYYAPQGAIHVSADQDPYTVFEAVEAGIVNQLNKEEN